MGDPREALVALLCQEDHAPMSTHDPRDGSCQSCPWPLHEMPPEDIADAILAKFDVTPREKVVVERDDSCSYCGRVHSDFAACGEDTTVTPTVHDHKWQRRQNVTSRGYRMPPYEVCVVDGCDAARQVDEPTALPSVEDVARELFDAEYHDIDATERNIEWGVVSSTDHARKHGTAWHRQARAVLALLPGRTEAEVKAEALREARNAWPVVTRDMVSRGQVRNWLGERADHIEKEADRG